MASAGVRIVGFTSPTGGAYPQQQTITIPTAAPGMVPKGAVFRLMGATAVDTLTAHARHSFGFTDGTTQLCVAYMAEHNVPAANADTGYRIDTATVLQLTGIGDETLTSEAAFISFGTDSVTIEWSADPGAILCSVALIYGTEVSCDVRSLTAPALVGNTVAVSGLSFQPDFLCVIGNNHAFAADGSGAEANFSIGFAGRSPSITQVCHAIVAEDRQSNTSASGIVRDDSVLTTLTSSAGVIAEATRLDVTAFASDGYTLTLQSATGAGDFMVLAVRFAGQPVFCDAPILTPTSVGTISITDPGFQSHAIFGIGTRLGTLGTTGANGRSIGGITAHGQGLSATSIATNAATSLAVNLASAANFVDAPINTANHDWVADAAITALGFDLDVTDASAGNRVLAYCAIREIPPEAPGIPPATRRWRRQIGRM